MSALDSALDDILAGLDKKGSQANTGGLDDIELILAGLPASKAPTAASSSSSSVAGPVKSVAAALGDAPIISNAPNAPKCRGCNQGIGGVCITACAAKWHPPCFKCQQCGKAFGDSQYFASEGLPYCSADYEELFAIRCAGCLRPVTDRCITALDKKWHPDHFLCAGCDKNLNGARYAVIKGQAFCHDCKELRQALDDPNRVVHQCGRCSKPIFGEFIMLQGVYLHPEHFSCFECGQALKGGGSFEFDNNMYCQYDYEKLIAASCAGCKKKIDGRGLTALGRQWHPECFCCCVCETMFSTTDYFGNEGKAYCREHYFAMFGTLCKACTKPIASMAIKAITGQWHQDCFKCAGCELSLTGKVYKEVDEKPVCPKCFKLLPAATQKKAEQDREARLVKEKADATAAAQAAKDAARAAAAVSRPTVKK